MPPSGVGKNLVRLAIATSPQEPIGRAPARPNIACAQSSISAMPRASHQARTASIGCGRPK